MSRIECRLKSNINSPPKVLPPCFKISWVRFVVIEKHQILGKSIGNQWWTSGVKFIHEMSWLVEYYIMAGHAIVVVKDITLLFYHRNAVILTLWYWLNDGKLFVWCKYNYFNYHLWLVKDNNHLKPIYIKPCNFLTKRAWVSQQCTLVVAKDSNISHYLNSWAYLVMIILAII